MKTNYYISSIFFLACFCFSCQQEDVFETEAPQINGVTMYVTDEDGNLQEVTSGQVGQTITFECETGADLCALWTGDQVPKKGYIESHDFSNYGITDYSDMVAVGETMDKSEDEEKFSITYKYREAGVYTLVIIATNHGQVGPNVQQTQFSSSFTVSE